MHTHIRALSSCLFYFRLTLECVWWTPTECRQVLRGAEERARAADADEHATTQALERLEDIDEVRA